MQLRSRRILAQYLDATDLSERMVARVAGLSHSTVNHLVTGRRANCSLQTARAIERALGCSPGTLFLPDPREFRTAGRSCTRQPEPAV